MLRGIVPVCAVFVLFYGFLVLKIVVLKVVFVQIVAAFHALLGLAELEIIQGRAAARQHYHKQEQKPARVAVRGLFLRGRGFLRLLCLRFWPGTFT